MSKEEWGVKRVCPGTGKRFYDMNRSPIMSPYTGEVVEIATGKSSTMTADKEDASKTAADVRKAAETETPEASEDEIDVDVDLGDDVLDDDDDDEDTVPLEELSDVAVEDED